MSISGRTHFLQGIAMKKRKFPRSAEEFRQYGITLEERYLVAIVVWNQDSMLGTQRNFFEIWKDLITWFHLHLDLTM